MKTPLPLKQLKKTRLYEEIAEQIKDAILDGHLKPAERLPFERVSAESGIAFPGWPRKAFELQQSSAKSGE